MGGRTSNGSGWQVWTAFIWLATGISGASRKHGDASLDFIKGGGFFSVAERLLGTEDGRCFMSLR